MKPELVRADGHLWRVWRDPLAKLWVEHDTCCGPTRTISDEEIHHHQVVTDATTGRPLIRGELSEDQRTIELNPEEA